MNKHVLDASALLAIVFDEPGHEFVRKNLRGALLSAVNYSEIMAKMHDKGLSADPVKFLLDAFAMTVVDFDKRQAVNAAALRPRTIQFGFSFADRACIALATTRRLPVLTGDRVWQKADLDIEVKLIR